MTKWNPVKELKVVTFRSANASPLWRFAVESGEGIESSSTLPLRGRDCGSVESGEGIESSPSSSSRAQICVSWNPVKELKVIELVANLCQLLLRGIR